MKSEGCSRREWFRGIVESVLGTALVSWLWRSRRTGVLSSDPSIAATAARWGEAPAHATFVHDSSKGSFCSHDVTTITYDGRGHATRIVRPKDEELPGVRQSVEDNHERA